MEDSEITALLLRRDESAIEAIEETYGARLKNLALNLLGSRQDAEECVNDALAAAWETPPQPASQNSSRPLSSKAVIRFIGFSSIRGC